MAVANDNPEIQARGGSGLETSTNARTGTDWPEEHLTTQSQPNIVTDQSTLQNAESSTIVQVQNATPVAIAISSGKIRHKPQTGQIH